MRDMIKFMTVFALGFMLMVPLGLATDVENIVVGNTNITITDVVINNGDPIQPTSDIYSREGVLNFKAEMNVSNPDGWNKTNLYVGKTQNLTSGSLWSEGRAREITSDEIQEYGIVDEQHYSTGTLPETLTINYNLEEQGSLGVVTDSENIRFYDNDTGNTTQLVKGDNYTVISYDTGEFNITNVNGVNSTDDYYLIDYSVRTEGISYFKINSINFEDFIDPVQFSRQSDNDLMIECINKDCAQGLRINTNHSTYGTQLKKIDMSDFSSDEKYLKNYVLSSMDMRIDDLPNTTGWVNEVTLTDYLIDDEAGFFGQSIVAIKNNQGEYGLIIPNKADGDGGRLEYNFLASNSEWLNATTNNKLVYETFMKSGENKQFSPFQDVVLDGRNINVYNTSKINDTLGHVEIIIRIPYHWKPNSNVDVLDNYVLIGASSENGVPSNWGNWVKAFANFTIPEIHSLSLQDGEQGEFNFDEMQPFTSKQSEVWYQSYSNVEDNVGISATNYTGDDELDISNVDMTHILNDGTTCRVETTIQMDNIEKSLGTHGNAVIETCDADNVLYKYQKLNANLYLNKALPVNTYLSSTYTLNLS